MVAVDEEVGARPTEELRAGRSFRCGVNDESTRSTRVRSVWYLYV